MSDFNTYANRPIILSKKAEEEIEQQGFSFSVGSFENLDESRQQALIENLNFLNELKEREELRVQQYREAAANKQAQPNQNFTNKTEYYMDSITEQNNTIDPVFMSNNTEEEVVIEGGLPNMPNTKPKSEAKRVKLVSKVGSQEKPFSQPEPVSPLATPTVDFTSYSTKDWAYVDFDELDSKGVGYPEGTELQIRSATPAEMAHWGNLAASNAKDLFESGVDILITNCVRMKVRGHVVDSRNIVYYDKFKLGLMIHKRTFPNGTNDIIAPFSHVGINSCVEPKQDLAVDYKMVSVWNMGQKFMKYYDKVNNVFNVPIYSPVSSLDRHKGKKGEIIDTFTLKIPTAMAIICMEFIKAATAQDRARYSLVGINQFKFMPLDWSKYLKDENVDSAKKLLEDYTTFVSCIAENGKLLWPKSKCDKLLEFQEAVDSGLLDKMPATTKCELCGGELKTDALFREGYTMPQRLFTTFDEE